MEIKRVICKKQVPMKDKIAGLYILMSIDTDKLNKILDSKEKTTNDAVYLSHATIEIEKASKLFGFTNLQDFIDFLNIYGPESIME